MKYNKKIKIFFAIFAAGVVITASVFFISGCEKTYSSQVRGVEYAKLTHAPLVPPPITRNHPTKVIVNLETSEVTRRIADGTEYNFWTFGGQVPGEFIRLRVGDEVEFHLSNSPTSKMPHNIDLHAVTGPGGGATSSFTAPGHTSVFSFKAEKPGLYVYHCATAPVGMHIANGMYGLVLVEPEGGLPPVDKEYYVMQGEFYTDGNFGDQGLQSFSLDKALKEQPTYVLFNGAVGSLTGKKALPAKVGETIRIYFGNGGPNLISAFHVIGEIFDKVYGDGGTKVIDKDVQTVLVPPGGAAMVEFKVEVPGVYTMVDHSIFRAFNKGAVGQINVTGAPNTTVYSGKQKDELYMNPNPVNQNEFWGGIPDANKPGTGANLSESSSGNSNSIENIKDMGKNIFSMTCQACHQAEGKGIPNVFPPLAGSDFLNADKERAIGIILHGKQGPVTVNGNKFNGVMPPQNLNDEQIAAVLTYVYHSFGNSGKTVTKEEVNKIRNQKVVSFK